MMDIEKIIDRIRFSLFSPEMVRELSAARVVIPDTYDDDGYPIDGGLVDSRLGVVDPGLRCKTCGGNVKDCPGHFGHIDLVRPVIHVEFAKSMYEVMRASCPHCHRATIEGPSEKPPKGKCPHCGGGLPDIKYLKPSTFFRDGNSMLPTEVQDWLASVPDEELRKIGWNTEYARPEWAILSVLLVSSVKVRPSITLESGERSEDDLTHKLVDIIRINQKLEANINAGAPQLIIEDLWELLQYHITTYLNNETANIPPARHRSGRPLKTLAQRLKGKEGRFRYNLLGKRVNFSARTVISPDPKLRLDEIGVPYAIAKELTVPIAVTEWNIDQCKKYVLADGYPRAIYILRPDGRKIKITEEIRNELAEDLKIGSTIERQIVDGDVSIFNRQPSLHRVSMMAHEVRVLPGKTFRLNPTTTPPYNADFDGDEMNLHILQTPESQAEARLLMKVEDQIISPRHGHAIVKPQEDHVSATYFFTRDDAIFTKEQAANLLYIAGITKLPKPDKGKNYTGKLLFSMLLPDDFSIKIKSKLKEEIVISKGKLKKGAIESRAIEKELLEKLFIKHGSAFTRKFIDDVTQMSLEALAWHGFSVSMQSYTLSDKAEKKVHEVGDKVKREIENLILQYKNGKLERSPGLSLRETLESNIMMATSKARNDAGKVVENDFGITNPSIIMATIGARGSLLNAIQMGALVGQQAIRSKRPSRGYYKRVLPFYLRGQLTARERGFVFSSFRDGLHPDEFFLASMGGRESLVNTAIRTARSGYMQRRLIHALQDLVVEEKGEVRNGRDEIVQFVYGGDCKDPMYATSADYFESTRQDDVDTV
ncbi:DNA-directed RNA polymerase subunit A' [Candidatus Micrarchaeota archaeon]|nr:DNA-directed RNA polymerase subunit A' [Candidatus Micrarchaeota archaeon]MBD3418038.1 DNA-directed RNA polymerase subunit A' [Candidatus Micrarchaeota archaeon]